MTGLGAHRGWLAALLAALVLLLSGDPLLRVAQNSIEQKIRQTETETKSLGTALDQLRADAATAERLGKNLKAGEMSAYLAPVDRRAIAAQLEPLARAAQVEHFTYTLSPEQLFKPGPAEADVEGLVESTLTFETDAPHDGDANNFLDRLLPLLSGRANVKQFSVERIGANGNAALAATNVRVHAVVGWLANTSRKGDDR